MADNRKMVVAQKRVALSREHLGRLSRWAELLALAKELERKIRAANRDAVLTDARQESLDSAMEFLMEEVLLSVPED